MKKALCLFFTLAISASVLAGCGSTNPSPMNKTVMPAAVAEETFNGYYMDDYYTGGDYSSTSINGDQADYSYSFSAEGDTDKDKSAMLQDYEAVQNLVNDKGGYIESVNNSYEYYTDDNLRYNEYARKYKANGYLSFTIQVDNSDVAEVIDYLEQLCKTNRFTVTSYTQRIQNYQSWKVVDDYDENQRGRVISKEDLERRLQYADVAVTLSYNIPRNKLAYAGYSIKASFEELWDNIKGVVNVMLALAAGLCILFAEAILFYKGFVRMVWKHREKRPQYYPPKEIRVVQNGKVNLKNDQ